MIEMVSSAEFVQDHCRETDLAISMTIDKTIKFS